MEKRLDYGHIGTVERMEDGRLRVMASISRVGTLDYRLSDGSTQTEHLTTDELFSSKSLETAGLAPVTLGHPEVGMVTPKNWRKYSVGATGSKVVARKNDGLVDVVFMVGDEEAIDAIENKGIREVSAGYTTELRSDGDKLYQTNRKYNHFALVKRGRAGETVRLHLDNAPDWGVQIVERADDEDGSERNPEPDQTNDSPLKEKTDMATYKGLDMSDDVRKLVTDMEGEMERMRSDMNKMKTDMGNHRKKDDADAAHVSEITEKYVTTKAKCDSLEAKVSELEKSAEGKLDAADIEKEVKKRLVAWGAALPFLPKDAKFDASDTEQVIWMKAIAAARPDMKLDGIKDEFGDQWPIYVKATFDSLTPPKSSGETNFYACCLLYWFSSHLFIQ